MTVEIPEQLESALKKQANARGISADHYIREVLQQKIETVQESESKAPLKTGHGMWAKYGISLSAEDIDENRREMLRNSIFSDEA
jgi:plasmid stability protein